jgi:hypothetical protein
MAERLACAYTSEVISANGVMPVARKAMAAFLEKRKPVWPNGGRGPFSEPQPGRKPCICQSPFRSSRLNIPK